MLSQVGWLQASRLHESLDKSALDSLAEPLEKRATQILGRRHEKLVKSGKRLAHGTPEVRHQVRVAAKKARDATEFFQSPHPARRVKRNLRRLATLQDALGGLNAAAVADGLLREVATNHPELAGSACFARGYPCAATKQGLPELGRLWECFGSTDPR